MNNEPPARIIFEFLCNGKLSIKLDWPYNTFLYILLNYHSDTR